MKKAVNKALLFALAIWFAAGAQAQSPGNSALLRLQTRWAEINYQLQRRDKPAAYDQLLEEAETFMQQKPDNAEILIWDGIINTSYANISGLFSRLKYARAARADFENALALDANALGGLAYAGLGTLYAQQPGWPLSFGSDEKAEHLLRRGVEISPEGIDQNFFLGEYLRGQHRYAESIQYFRRALRAAARPGLELADQGRRNDIQQALAMAQQTISQIGR